MTRAESLLNAALGPDDPAQTVGQRLVWYARAELALARNDPLLALHITDQLLASAVGLSSESSIPRLSKLRGEALTKLKQGAEAETILQQARATALKHGLRPLLWRIYLTQGKLAHAQRRYEEAERRFAEALELLEDLASSLPDRDITPAFSATRACTVPSHTATLSTSSDEKDLRGINPTRTCCGRLDRPGQVKSRDCGFAGRRTTYD